MSAGQQIVDALLGGGDYAKRLALRGVRRRPPNVYSIQFGFAVHTSDDYEVKQNAMEHGIKLTGDLTKGHWKTLADDMMALERNAMMLLKRNGFDVRDEGHSDDELIGSAWIQHRHTVAAGKFPAKEAVKALKRFIDTDEPFRTSSGSINKLLYSRYLYAGVSKLGRSLIDVDISIFHHDAIKQELERYDDWINARVETPE